MKIGILTQPLHTNYGGILQAYAVQKLLRERGHDVVTLDTSVKRVALKMSFLQQLYRFMVSTSKFLLGRISHDGIEWPYNTQLKNVNLIHITMRNFYEQIISLSPVIQNDDEMHSYVMEQHFDAFVVGSDQVWRPRYSPNIGWFFLDFLSPNDKVKRYALSASFGTSEWEFTSEERTYILPLVKLFDAISVRELSGVELCRKYLYVDAKQVLDPTMMLQPSDYARIVEMDLNSTYSMKGTIFAYMLDAAAEKKNVIERLSTVLQTPIKSFSATGTYGPFPYGPYASEKTALKLGTQSLAQWLRAFQEAKLVVTDSFHGTVFSILHHRPFVVLANHNRGLARIETLLQTFGLEERLINTTQECSIDWLIKNIDWNDVDAVLEQKRQSFIEFLKLI